MKKIILSFILCFFCSLAYAATLTSVNTICLAIDGETCNADNGRSYLHPTVIDLLVPKDGFRYWMWFTPWPSNADEDLWLCRSNTMEPDSWDCTTDVTNPLLTETDLGATFYADPDVLYIKEYDMFLLISGPGYAGGGMVTLHYSSDGKSWNNYVGSINGLTSPKLISGNDSDGRTWEVDGSSDSAIQYSTALFMPGNDTSDWADDEIWVYYGSTANGENQGEVGLAKFKFNPNTGTPSSFARYEGSGEDGALFFIPADNSNTSFEALQGMGHLSVSIDSYSNKFRMLHLRMNESGKFAGGGFFLSIIDSSDGINWNLPEVDTDNWTKLCTNTGIDGTTSEDSSGCYRSVFLHDGTGRVVRYGASVLTTEKILFYTGYNGTFTAQEGYHVGVTGDNSRSSGAAGVDTAYILLGGFRNIP